MRSLTVRILAAALLCGTVTLTAAAQGGKQEPTAADKIRKLREGLNQKVTFDFTSQNFNDGIEHLRQKTKLPITLDPNAFPGFGLQLDNIPMQVHLKSDNGPVRTTLQKMLSPHHLTYILLNDGVFITSESNAYARQMRQRVNVDVKDKALDTALKDLAAETGITLLIDPRQRQVARAQGVTLALQDATLETAVRLLTELADLKAVQVGNVTFVTDAKRAAEIRKENNDLQRNNQNYPQVYTMPFIGGMGGFGGGIGGIGGARPGVAVPPPPLKQAPPVPPKAG